jgi:DNA-directed RNA polymerase specialized sigma24 family protein
VGRVELTPRGAAILDQLRVTVKRLQQTQDERLRLIIRARRAGVTYREIAAAQGTTIEAVMKMLDRARKRGVEC